jgi:predicted nucleotidyltransferase
MLELEPRHLAMVRRILEAHVPDCEVRAFGSRVQGPAKPHSDLDLTVMTTSPLPIGVKVRLEHAFAESELPFKVDVLYWDEIGEGFRRLIEQGWEWVQESAAIREAIGRKTLPS